MGLFSFIKSSLGWPVGTVGTSGGAEVAERQRKIAEMQAQMAAIHDDNARRVKANEVVAAHLEAAVLSYGLSIRDLSVKFDGVKATITGAASTPADREKAILAVGNTNSVNEVDDQLTVVHPASEAIFHTVLPGDTLSKVARDVYGVMRLFDVVFEANQPMLTHPDKIFPGQVLRIPHAEPPKHTVAAGETLGSIAKHWYGDPAKYTAIFEANRGELSSPDRIAVGQVLTIPLMNPKI